LALLITAWLTFQNEKTNVYYSQRGSIVLNNIAVTSLSVANPNNVIGYLIIPRWENVGNTEVTNVRFSMNYQFSRDPLPNGFTAVDGSSTTTEPISMGSKQVTSASGFRDAQGAPGLFPQACINDVTQGKFRYVEVWGWAKYRDVFRPDIERITRMCWRLHGLLTLGSESTFNHVLCDEGNCQDESCDKYKLMTPPKLPVPETCQQTIVIPAAAVPTEPPATPVPQPSPTAPSK
jgi:hypothetical protein